MARDAITRHASKPSWETAGLDRDALLMLRVAGEDYDSFTELVQRHRTGVYGFLFRIVQNSAVAEELSQEVLLRVYRSRHRYEPTARFSTWLYRIATNLALNYRRDHQALSRESSLDSPQGEDVKQELPDRLPTIEARLIAQVRSMEILRAVESLPAKQRTAVLLHKYEGMDYSQIARILACTVSALKSILFRAYQTLRRRLAHYS